MSESVPAFAGLSLSKIGDLGVHVMQVDESPPPPPGASDEEKLEKAAETGRGPK